MKAIKSVKISVNIYQSTRRNILEYCIFRITTVRTLNVACKVFVAISRYETHAKPKHWWKKHIAHKATILS